MSRAFRTNFGRGVAIVAILGFLVVSSLAGGASAARIGPAPAPHGATPFDRAAAAFQAATASLALGASPAGGVPLSCSAPGSGTLSCAPIRPAVPTPHSGTPPTWTNLTASMAGNYPSNRWIAAMAYDPVDQYVVLFGGYGGTFPLPTDTWAFSNGQWTLLSPNQSPTGRYGTTMAWDAADSEIVLFGGYEYIGTTLAPQNDTWTFVHGQWTNVTNYSAAPPTRWRAVMAYDPVDQYVVLFGGTQDAAGTVILGDTWKFVAGNWTKLTVSGNPAGHFRAEATWDDADGYLVMFGGCTSTTCPSQDTWTYVNGTWTFVNPATKPAAREYVGITFDPVLGDVVMFGGTTSSTFYSDTWTFHNGTWTAISETTHPNNRAYVAMAWDPLDGYGLLFGGATSSAGGYQNDTWALGPSILGRLQVAPTALDLGQSATLNATPVAFKDFVAFNWTALPAGCSGGNVSVIACTPNATGTFPISVTLNDSSGEPTTKNASLQVFSDPAITGFTASPAVVTRMTATTLNLTHNTGGVAPYSFSYAGLPGGCSSRNSANLTCVPTAAGTFTINATLSDTAGWHAHATVVLTVNPQPAIIGFSAVPATIDAGQTTTLYANTSGGTSPLTFAYSGLPAGCSSFNLSSIGCTPNGPGIETVSVVVTDVFGWNTTATTTLTVNPALVVSAFAISTATTDVGQPVRFWLNATGGTGAISYAYGGLPGGCTLTPGATATCSPTATGTFTISGAVTDTLGTTVSSTVVLTVNPDPLVSDLRASPNVVDVHQTVKINATVTGGTAPISYRYSGLPTGCATSDTASLTCQPAADGSFSITVVATDRFSQVSQLGTQLTVNAAPTISSFSASASQVVVGATTTITVVANAGSGTYSYVYSGLPDGCVTANTSTLSCTPTTAGGYTVGVLVTDSLGETTNATLPLTVSTPSSSGSFLGLSGTTGYLLIAVVVVVVAAIAAALVLMRRRRSPPAPAASPEEWAEGTPGETPP